jgi:spore germination cell wall hydrolase CwlJ-like protein
MSILNYNDWSLNESSSYLSGVSDIEVIAATLIGEAGGEGDKGMQAIKNVLDNRASKKGTTSAGEALRPKQFSMWNRASANVSVRSDFDSELINSIIKGYKSHEKWSKAVDLASGILSDITKDATLYYAHNKIKPPYWTKNWKQTAIIGNHTFGKVS